MPIHFVAPALVSLFFALVLAGCTLTPEKKDIDDYGPMPAATQDKADPAAHRVDPAPVLPRSTKKAKRPQEPEDLWERIRLGYQLSAPMQHARIVEQRQRYANYPTYVYKILERGSRYLHYIVEEAENRDLPLELALLPMVESAFDPFAYSRGHAAGPWQFISSTGRAFGLEQDWWKDDRRDIIASTDAALTYLEQLADRFDGDWLLALAAYNAGGGNVSRAIIRNEQAGKPTDFWHLSLPQETMDYVPKLLAVAELIRDPEHYGITLPELPNEAYFETVTLPGQLDLSKAAKLAQIPLEELQLLNPAFNREATAPNGPHRLLLPVDKAKGFGEEIAKLPPSALKPQDTKHVVKRGDTLIGIARQHNVSVASLKQVNGLNSNTIMVGKTLSIPGPSTGSEKTTQSYVVQRGDTLWRIAKRHGVSVQQLQQWNTLDQQASIQVGQVLKLNASAQGNASEHMVKKVNYEVRRGDTLSGIAQRFKVALNELKAWNPQQRGILTPGERLVVYVDVRNTH